MKVNPTYSIKYLKKDSMIQAPIRTERITQATANSDWLKHCCYGDVFHSEVHSSTKNWTNQSSGMDRWVDEWTNSCKDGYTNNWMSDFVEL